jgi:hypothetical protein
VTASNRKIKNAATKLKAAFVARERIFIVTVFLLILTIEAHYVVIDAHFLQTNSLHFNCLISKSQELESCRAELLQNPIDADFCGEAVKSCRDNGSFALAKQASRVNEIFVAITRYSRRLFLVLLGYLLIRYMFMYLSRPPADSE